MIFQQLLREHGGSSGWISSSPIPSALRQQLLACVPTQWSLVFWSRHVDVLEAMSTLSSWTRLSWISAHASSLALRQLFSSLARPQVQRPTCQSWATMNKWLVDVLPLNTVYILTVLRGLRTQFGILLLWHYGEYPHKPNWRRLCIQRKSVCRCCYVYPHGSGRSSRGVYAWWKDRSCGNHSWTLLHDRSCSCPSQALSRLDDKSGRGRALDQRSLYGIVAVDWNVESGEWKMLQNDFLAQ